VDDDATFREVLGRALARRGFIVEKAANVAQAVQLLEIFQPDYAVFDLKLPDASGLVLVEMLHQLKPEACIVVLTGYGSITTAVDAIRLGATNFLTKPANADDIVAAFSHTPRAANEFVPPQVPLSRFEEEAVMRALDEHQGNITRAAGALNMHRRTLQRKLARLAQEDTPPAGAR